MRVVSGSSYDSLSCLLDLLVPPFKTLSGSLIKSCEQQIRITAIGPESIEEHHDGVYLACVGVNIVNLDAVITAGSPTLELLRVCHHVQAITASRENFLRRMLTVISSLRIAWD